jgi:HTH-type transcriptional regulator/antitoxin HigA
MTKNYDPTRYGALLMEALPSVIETEEENEKALAIVASLIDKGAEGGLSPEEERLMSLLAQLIENYEDKAYPLSEISPAERLRVLMSDNALKQKDLAGIFGGQSVVSQILSGKREITKDQAKNLSERFNLPVEVFI